MNNRIEPIVKHAGNDSMHGLHNLLSLVTNKKLATWTDTSLHLPALKSSLDEPTEWSGRDYKDRRLHILREIVLQYIPTYMQLLALDKI